MLLQELLLLFTSSPAQPVPQLLFGTGHQQKGPPSSQRAQRISPHPLFFFFPGWCYFYFSVHTHGGCHSRWQEGSAPRGCRRGSSAPWLQPSRPSPQLHQLSCVVDGECTGEKAERHPVKSRKATMHRGGASHRGSVAPTTLLESLSLQERHFFFPLEQHLQKINPLNPECSRSLDNPCSGKAEISPLPHSVSIKPSRSPFPSH